MDSQEGPISITALLASSNNQVRPQQNTNVYQQTQSLPPLPPKPQQQSPRNVTPPLPNNIPKVTEQSYPQQQFQNYQQQQEVQYQPQVQMPQPQSEYYFQNLPTFQNEPIQKPVFQPPQIQPIPTQLPNGYHILNHHNPALVQQLQPVIMRQQILPPQNIQRQQQAYQQRPQKQHQVSRIYELTEEQVTYSKPAGHSPSIVVTPPTTKNQIIAKPIQNSRGLVANSRQVSNPSNEYILKCDDKLLNKIQQMQSQITKLSRAIIKKDNQQLSTELSLNQIIQQKDIILEKKNRQLQASTRRIKLLIEQSENKDLQIQRLKLEIQRANRLNNVSFDMSKQDLQIRNDTDYNKTSAYFKDLVSQSQFPNRNQMVPTKQLGNNRINHIQQGFMSPAQIDLRFAKPAGENNIYQPSGNRHRNNY